MVKEVSTLGWRTHCVEHVRFGLEEFGRAMYWDRLWREDEERRGEQGKKAAGRKQKRYLDTFAESPSGRQALAITKTGIHEYHNTDTHTDSKRLGRCRR